MHQIRTPVKRESASRYLSLTLISFAVSVIGTRSFLQVTNFPQIASGQIHIAHVLFGGILLFTASILPLILANRSILVLSAIFSGLGIGLFIDEVGKFITSSNNYFYPPAIPIIYAFFLIIVLIYMEVKKKPHANPRADLYRSLDSFSEVLDYDLEPHELNDLQERLKSVAECKDSPEFVSLAKSLLSFLESKELITVPDNKTIIDKIVLKISEIEEKYVKKGIFKAVLIIGLTLTGFISILDLIRSYSAFSSYQELYDLLTRLIASGIEINDISIYWFFVRLILEAIVGVALILSAFLIAKGSELRGSSLAFIGILLSLTCVNLLVFYFDQTGAFLSTCGQLILFLMVFRFRQKYLFSSQEG